MTEESNNENENLAADIADAAGDVPAEEDTVAARIAALEEELATAKQETLYALADTQNVRRRMEKELGDARAYASTAFARDILSVADNLSRALDAIPADLREDEKFKGLVIGLEATGKELESVFRKHGVRSSSRSARSSIPTSIRRCWKSRWRTPRPARSCRRCRRAT